MKPEVHAWELWLFLKLAAKVGLIPAGFGATWLGRKWMLSRSTHWPTTWGTVTGYAPGTESGTYQQTTLFYSYSVDGQTFTGEMISPKNLNGDSDYWGLPLGSNIEVRYSPRNPARAVALLPQGAFAHS